MASLMSKNISFTTTKKVFSLDTDNALIFYYIPQKAKLSLQRELRNYKVLSLYKRNAKHSSLFPSVIKHFSPALGIIKVSSAVELNNFLVFFNKNLKPKFPNMLLTTLFLNLKPVFFFSFNNYNYLKNFINNSLFLLVYVRNILLSFLRKFVYLHKCMLFSYKYKIDAHS